MTQDFNLAAHVLRAGAATPDKIALAVVSPARAERWSYARLTAAVAGTAAGLLARGLTPGDRVLLRLGNSADFPVAYLGALWAGLVPVPTSAMLTRVEITGIARTLAPALVVGGEDAPLPDHPAPVLPGAALRAMADLPGLPAHAGSADRPGYILFTSGTTGRTRGVVHAHRAVLARAMMHQGWEGIGPDDRLLHAGAFNWPYTLGTGLLDPWTVGATAVIPAAGTAPAALPLLLARHDVTIMAAAPGVFRQMLRADMPALPRLRHGLSAGEKLTATLAARWTQATGTVLHEAFGMTEVSTFISGSPARPAPAGTLGFPQPGRQVAIIGPDGTPLPAGETGDIAVHRSDPGLMLGYLDAPDDTAARYRGDWFATGDMGRMQPDGAILYEGRADDMMNAGGFRVSPVEVEEALAACPGVAEVAAVEVPVKADATVIAAFWAGPAPIADEVLTAFAASRLARYKQPRIWVRVDALPRGANAKILRKALRAQWETRDGAA